SLFSWQTYEQLPITTGKSMVPNDYPYHARTSLFSAFQWISEDLLREESVKTMSIFVTTHYSCFETILNESIYSRDNAPIKIFTSLYRLTLDDVKDILHDFYGRKKDIIA